MSCCHRAVRQATEAPRFTFVVAGDPCRFIWERCANVVHPDLKRPPAPSVKKSSYR